MRAALRAILHEPGLAAKLAAHGRQTIEQRHSCAHRVDELLAICASLAPQRFAAAPAPQRAVA